MSCVDSMLSGGQAKTVRIVTKDKIKSELENRDKVKVVSNLRVGSAASLPELSEANPHLTISAFSIALAEEFVRTRAEKLGLESYSLPPDLAVAAKQYIDSGRVVHIRRMHEEAPLLGERALAHSKLWDRVQGESELD